MLDTLCRRSSSRRSILGRGVTLGMLPPVARVSVDVAAWEAGRIREGISGTTMRGVSRRLQRRTKSRNDRAAAVSESSARYRKLWYGPYESRESRHGAASRCVRTATRTPLSRSRTSAFSIAGFRPLGGREAGRITPFDLSGSLDRCGDREKIPMVTEEVMQANDEVILTEFSR